MIFLSDDVARVELRLFVDEVAPVGHLVRSDSGALEVEPSVATGVALGRMERWLDAAGLEIVHRRRRGRRWTIRARLRSEH